MGGKYTGNLCCFVFQIVQKAYVLCHLKKKTDENTGSDIPVPDEDVAGGFPFSGFSSQLPISQENPGTGLPSNMAFGVGPSILVSNIPSYIRNYEEEEMLLDVRMGSCIFVLFCFCFLPQFLYMRSKFMTYVLSLFVLGSYLRTLSYKAYYMKPHFLDWIVICSLIQSKDATWISRRPVALLIVIAMEVCSFRMGIVQSLLIVCSLILMDTLVRGAQLSTGYRLAHRAHWGELMARGEDQALAQTLKYSMWK